MISRPKPPLGRCPSCKNMMDMSMIGKTNAPMEGGPVTLWWFCGHCSANGTVTYGWDRAHRLFNQWADWLGKAQKSYDTEAVGQEVQGFRNLLDDVQTPAEMEAVWGHSSLCAADGCHV